jgi:hypothetical protein
MGLSRCSNSARRLTWTLGLRSSGRPARRIRQREQASLELLAHCARGFQFGAGFQTLLAQLIALALQLFDPGAQVFYLPLVLLGRLFGELAGPIDFRQPAPLGRRIALLQLRPFGVVRGGGAIESRPQIRLQGLLHLDTGPQPATLAVAFLQGGFERIRAPVAGPGGSCELRRTSLSFATQRSKSSRVHSTRRTGHVGTARDQLTRSRSLGSRQTICGNGSGFPALHLARYGVLSK